MTRPGTFPNLETADQARAALHQVDPALHVRIHPTPQGVTVYASLPDEHYGGFVTRRIMAVPSPAEAREIVQEMLLELERRTIDARHRRALERDRNHE